jgi:imidazoleglycerol phosphate dehydratase HisB
MTRTTAIERTTSEVRITGELNLDGSGKATISTGLGFLDHMLSAMTRHGGFDLTISVDGDTDVDDHHTVEDCAIVIGRAIDELLGDRSGIERFASSHVPLDESLVRAVVDLSGRGWPEIHLPFTREVVGDVAAENIVHFFRTLAIEARLALHVDLIRGDNSHHIAEAAFKAVARALRAAVSVSGSEVPSTKGVLG